MAAKQRWRVGRKVGRTVYLQLGLAPSDDDMLIGTMDTPALAELAVTQVNRHLDEKADETAVDGTVFTPGEHVEVVLTGIVLPEGTLQLADGTVVNFLPRAARIRRIRSSSG